jgi:hypothetical protein
MPMRLAQRSSRQMDKKISVSMDFGIRPLEPSTF